MYLFSYNNRGHEIREKKYSFEFTSYWLLGSMLDQAIDLNNISLIIFIIS